MGPLESKAYQAFELAREIEAAIIKLFKQHNITTLHTENADCDVIWGYIYDGDALKELEVKGISIQEGIVYVCLDVHLCSYTDQELECLETLTDNEWLPLFGSEVLGTFTAINIADTIEEYFE